MSRNIKVHYTSFNRYILAEFLPERVLNQLDKEYTKAKVRRMIKLCNAIGLESDFKAEKIRF